MNAAAAGVSTIIDHPVCGAERNFLYLQDCNIRLPVTIPFSIQKYKNKIHGTTIFPIFCMGIKLGRSR